MTVALSQRRTHPLHVGVVSANEVLSRVDSRGAWSLVGAEGCDRPASWAEANHIVRWSSGGLSDLGNCVLLCKRHYALADHPDYAVEALNPGRIRIARRRRVRSAVAA